MGQLLIKISPELPSQPCHRAVDFKKNPPLAGASIAAWLRGSSSFSALMIWKLLASPNIATASAAPPRQALSVSMASLRCTRSVALSLPPHGLSLARNGDFPPNHASGCSQPGWDRSQLRMCRGLEPPSPLAVVGHGSCGGRQEGAADLREVMRCGVGCPTVADLPWLSGQHCYISHSTSLQHSPLSLGPADCCSVDTLLNTTGPAPLPQWLRLPSGRLLGG